MQAAHETDVAPVQRHRERVAHDVFAGDDPALESAGDDVVRSQLQGTADEPAVVAEFAAYDSERNSQSALPGPVHNDLRCAAPRTDELRFDGW